MSRHLGWRLLAVPQRSGDRRVIVELPGVYGPKEATEVIGRTPSWRSTRSSVWRRPTRD